MNMSMKDGLAGPLLGALMFLVLAGLRMSWHQSALIPAICAILFAVKAIMNLRKRSA